jgi:hypothetical protein
MLFDIGKVFNFKTKFFVMKKVILGLVFLFAVVGVSKISAQAQESQKVTFYYYPSSNVYYNVAATDYWYYDEATKGWVEVKTLPATVTLEKAPRYTVFYNGTDVWKENAEHVKKYKVKDNGELKEKKSKG